jgi:predicted nucleotidyltransferase
MFEKLLSIIGKRLDLDGIPYMIIGGQAVLLYGEPRLTRDIDITLGIDSHDLEKFLKTTEDLRLKILPEDVTDFVQETMVLPTLDEASGIRVDFIFSYTPYERSAIKRAKGVKIIGQTVKFAALEDLIIHKIFAGRPRDLDDVKSVLIKNRDIDLKYIRKWLKEFDKGLDKEIFLDQFERIYEDVGTRS